MFGLDYLIFSFNFIMKPLSGIVELTGNFLQEREMEINNGVIGLGPPDLICLWKSKSKIKNVISFHHLCGFPMDSENDALHYFNILLKMRPKKVFGQVRYDITQAKFCIWNSFSKVDFHISIQNKVIDSITISNPVTNETRQANPNEIEPNLWRELRLSQILRFWIAPTPIFRTIYTLPIKSYGALRLLNPPKLTEEDIQFIVDNHQPCQEVEFALASFLISKSATISNLEHLLKEIIIPKMPRVLYHFIPLFPNTRGTNLSKTFSVLSNLAYESMIDDIHLACCNVLFAIESENIDSCQSSIPILLNGLWCSCEACCAMAHLAISSGLTTESLFYTNAACYARNYRHGENFIQDLPTPKLESKKAPKSNQKKFEVDFLKSIPSNGHQYLIYRTIVAITTIASSLKVRTILKKKFDFTSSPLSSLSKRSNSIPIVSSSRTNSENQNNQIQIDDQNFSKDSTGKLIRAMNDVEYAEFCGQPTQPDDTSLLLYDVGVGTINPEIPFYVKNLPFSTEFSAIANKALDDMQMRDSFMRNKKIDLPDMAKTASIIAFKLCDINLLNLTMSAFSKMKKHKIILELTKMKLLPFQKWEPISKSIQETTVNKMTINEYNALMIMSQLANGIASLMNTKPTSDD